MRLLSNINRPFLRFIAPLLLGTICLTANASNTGATEQLPIPNPYLADPTYSTVHSGSGYGCFSSVPGPQDLKRPLKKSEIKWRPTELASWSINYSSPYPNGQRVAWTGGGKVLFKMDADTLEVIDSIAVREGDYMSPQQVSDYVDKLDNLSGKEYYQTAIDTLLKEMGGAASFYKLISADNELYLLVNDIKHRKTYLRVYGDAVAGDASSKIALKREWELPKVADTTPFGFSINMSYDGRLIVATRDGTLFSVATDLSEYSYVVVPGGGKQTQGMSNSFLRNAPPIDPDGGIYVVTSEVMHKVVWTGKALSIDPKDGAWSSPYPKGLVGSGTTPSIMGWGDNEDKLVLIGDGRPEGKMHIWAFWRNEIPADWKGVAGKDRRVAGIAPVDYGKHTPKNATVENNMTVKGYGVYVTNDSAVAEITTEHYEGRPEGTWLASYSAVSKDPDFVSYGGLKYEWNPNTRKLELAWATDRSFTTSVPVVDINNTLYGIGWRAGIFTLEAVNWLTGESKFHYELGTGARFNIYGASLSIAPNGAIDCPCQGGVGITRIQPLSE